MAKSEINATPAEPVADSERLKQLKAFDESKSGVKGLVDSGITKIPKIFVRPPNELSEELNRKNRSDLRVPVIDLSGIESQSDREKIVEQVKQASEDWGMFYIQNHGIPSGVIDGMVDGVRKFHKLDVGVKKELYSRDLMKKVRYESNLDLYTLSAANWRDTLHISLLADDSVELDELPPVCRNSTIEFINHISKLGETLFELLSEALGVKSECLREMDCTKGKYFAAHYYPACPEPELTIGSSKHTDPAFLTVLLQDQIGGLQLLHDDVWIDVQPVEAALVVNIADLLQMVSNDKFKSAVHRVMANQAGPRISVACLFCGVIQPPKTYGPVEELISEENPPIFKEFTISDYIAKRFSSPENVADHFKL